MRLHLAVIAAGLAVGACEGGDDEPRVERPPATLSYEYRDASVPPPVHRSYTLMLTDADRGGAAGRLVVDSYGDVLHDVEVTVADDAWQRAIGDVAALGLAASSGEECAGGTGRAVVLAVDGETVVDSEISDCGDAGDADRLDEAVAPLLAGVDLDTMLAPAAAPVPGTAD